MSSAAALGPVTRATRPSSPALGLLELGRQLFDQNHFADAALALQRRMRLAPHDAEARYLLALCLTRVGQPAKAAQLLDASRVGGSLDAGTCLEIGAALIPTDPATAHTWLASAVAAAPGDEVALRHLEEVRLTLDGEVRRVGRHRLTRLGRLRRNPA